MPIMTIALFPSLGMPLSAFAPTTSAPCWWPIACLYCCVTVKGRRWAPFMPAGAALQRESSSMRYRKCADRVMQISALWRGWGPLSVPVISRLETRCARRSLHGTSCLPGRFADLAPCKGPSGLLIFFCWRGYRSAGPALPISMAERYALSAILNGFSPIAAMAVPGGWQD